MMTPDALFEAIFRGDLDKVRVILESAPELVNVRDGNGDAPIHAAVEILNPGMVRLLMEKGARTDARNGDGNSVLDLVGMETTSSTAEPPDPEKLSKLGEIMDLVSGGSN